MSQLAEWIWSSFPRLIARASATGGSVLADGRYLASWPGVAVAGAILSVLIGGFVAARQTEVTFTYSIVLMTMLVFVSGFGAGTGAWAWLGFMAVDLAMALTGSAPRDQPLSAKPILYLVLATLVVLIPLAALTMREQVMHLVRSSSRALRVTTHALLQAILIYAWAQAAAFLVRPAWSFARTSPEVAGIAPLQHRWWWLVAAGVVAAVIRVSIELRGAATAPLWAMNFGLGAESRRSPRWMSVGLRALVLTMLLAGLLETRWQALVVFALLAGALVLQEVAGRAPPIAWFAARVPLVLRVAGVAVVAYLIATRTVEPVATRTDSFRPMLDSIVASLVVSAVLLPRTER